MYFRYLQACIITIFFFLSGYLKRDRGTLGNNVHKYIKALAVPYLVYNLLMLPYWVARFYLQQGAWPDWAALSRPILGALLMQHSSSIAEPLNGTLWYLPAILLMHIVTDLCHRSRHEHLLLSGLCVFTVVGYYLYKVYAPHPTLLVMGFLRRFPYFYLGYIAGQRRWLRQASPKSDAQLGAAALAASASFFMAHVATIDSPALHLALFYPVNVGFLVAVVCGCRLLGSHPPQWVVNISVGTLVIVGLQWMVIGTVNYAIGLTTGACHAGTYQWYEALPLAILITALLYPVIKFSQHHAPLLVGREH